nr:hypothetical protein [Lachnospiraceae bacterium]
MSKKAMFKRVTALVLSACMCFTYVPTIKEAEAAVRKPVAVATGYTTEYLTSVSDSTTAWSSSREISIQEKYSVGEEIVETVPLDIPEGYTATYQWYVRGDEKETSDIVDSDLTQGDIDAIVGERVYSKTGVDCDYVYKAVKGADSATFKHVLSEDDLIYKDVFLDYIDDYGAQYYLQVNLKKGDETVTEYYGLRVEESYEDYYYPDITEDESTSTTYVVSGESVTIQGATWSNENYKYTYSWSKSTSNDSTEKDKAEGNTYTVNNFSEKDEGGYTLNVVISRKGKEYSKLNIENASITYALRLKETSSTTEDNIYTDVDFSRAPIDMDVEAAVGEEVTLSSSATLSNEDAEGKITYQWYFGDDKIPDATEPEYSVVPTSSASYGYYKCVTSIKLSEKKDGTKCYFTGTEKTTKDITAMWQVTKISSLTVENDNYSMISGEVGDKKDLEVKASSKVGDVKYSWISQTITGINSEIITNSTTCSAINVEVTDMPTMYQCTVSDANDSMNIRFVILSEDFIVNPFAAPYSVGYDTCEYIYAKVGDPAKLGVRFNTSINGYTCEYKWYKNVNGIERVVQGATSSSISIDSLKESDFGDYHCNVIVYYKGNKVGDEDKSFYIDKATTSEYPDYIYFESNTTGAFSTDGRCYAGNDYGLCVLPRKKADITYKWVFYPEACSYDDDGNVVGITLPETGSVLNLDNYDSSMSGEYKCIATYQSNSGVKSATLDFTTSLASLGDIEFYYPSPDEFDVQLGGTFKATINAKCTGASELKYQWYYVPQKGAVIGSGTKIEGATSPTIQIDNMTESDYGYYYLVVDNGVTTAKSQEIEVNLVDTDMEILYRDINDRTFYGNVGEDITINFSVPEDMADGFTYSWYDEDYNFIKSTITDSLTLENISKEDYGQYNCTINYVNSSGSTQDKSITFFVYPKADVVFTNPGENATTGYAYLTDNYDAIGHMSDMFENDVDFDYNTSLIEKFKTGEISYGGTYTYYGNAVRDKLNVRENDTITLNAEAESKLGNRVRYKWYKVYEGSMYEITGADKSTYTTVITDSDISDTDYNYSYLCLAYTDTSYAVYETQLVYGGDEFLEYMNNSFKADKLVRFITEGESVTLNYEYGDNYSASDFSMEAWAKTDLANISGGINIMKYGNSPSYEFIPDDSDFTKLKDGVEIAVYVHMGTSVNQYNEAAFTPFFVVKVDPEKLKSETVPSLNLSKLLTNTLPDMANGNDIISLFTEFGDEVVKTYTEPGAEKITLSFDESYSLNYSDFDFTEIELTVIDANGNKTIYGPGNDIAGKTLEFEGDTVTFCYGMAKTDTKGLFDKLQTLFDASTMDIVLALNELNSANYGYKANKVVIPEEDETYAELLERLAELEKKVAEMEEAQTPTGSSVEPSEEPSVEPSEEPSVEPSVEPSEKPSMEPSDEPPVKPSDEPSIVPSEEASVEPSVEPSEEPSSVPTESAAVPTGSALTPTESAVVPSESPSASPAAES